MAMGIISRRLSKSAHLLRCHPKPYVDYSEEQDGPSDNCLYPLAFIQNSRYLFGAEECIVLSFCFKRCSDLSC
jgi:hypothetical protein